MRNFSFLALSFLFLACGKDDTCTLSSFYGTYSPDGSVCSVEDANKLVFSQGSDSGTLKIALTGSSRALTFDKIPIANCTFSGLVNDGNTNMTVSGVLDGKNLSFTLSGTFISKPINCTEKWKK